MLLVTLFNISYLKLIFTIKMFGYDIRICGNMKNIRDYYLLSNSFCLYVIPFSIMGGIPLMFSYQKKKNTFRKLPRPVSCFYMKNESGGSNLCTRSIHAI